jgi:hypothetical protein
VILGDEIAIFIGPHAGSDGVGKVGGKEIFPAGGIGMFGGVGDTGGGEEGEDEAFHGDRSMPCWRRDLLTHFDTSVT